MSTFITKARLVSLVSASAILGSMAVAALPVSTMAASTCEPTGFVRDGIDLTAAKIGGSVTGALDATGCDIGVYNPTRVSGANIHGARYYGIVVNGDRTVNTTNSKVHEIGDLPVGENLDLRGMQRGRAIFYINGADGTISGNRVYDFQKNGIDVRGLTEDQSAPSSDKSVVTIANNVVTGLGSVDFIAQNGIVVLGNASVTVKDNVVSDLRYTGPANATAAGLLSDASKVLVSGNRIVDTQVRIDGAVKAIRNVRGSFATTIRPNRIRIHFTSEAQPRNTVMGKRLNWVVKVDGRKVTEFRQGFRDHDDFVATSNQRVQIYKNGNLVKTLVVQA